MHSSGLAVLGLCLLACLFVQAARDLYGRRGHGRQSQVCVCVLIDTILLHNKSHSKMNLQAITTRLCARCLCYGCGLAGCVCTVPMVGYGLSSISATIPRAYMHDDDDHSDGFMADQPSTTEFKQHLNNRLTTNWPRLFCTMRAISWWRLCTTFSIAWCWWRVELD